MALKVLVRPGLIERGNVKPDRLNPVPAAVAWVIVRTAFPVLPIWIVCVFEEPTVTLPKFALEGVRLIAGCRPVPVTLTTVFPPREFVTVMLPETFSWAFGWNDTLSVCVCPGVNVTGVVTPLAVTSVALTVICEMVTFPVPPLVSTTFLELVVPALTLPKARLVGFADRTTVPETPVPVRAIVEGEVGALLVIVMVAGRLPAVVGAKVALKVALAPAAIVLGVANPLKL